MPRIKYRDADIDLMAKMMRAEAEGEGQQGMLYVGNVIVNSVISIQPVNALRHGTVNFLLISLNNIVFINLQLEYVIVFISLVVVHRNLNLLAV